MPTVVSRLTDPNCETLLKMDIEGGEQQLFQGDLSWLGRFAWLFAELHPARADIERIATLIEAEGLHFRPGAGRGGPTACWTRH